MTKSWTLGSSSLRVLPEHGSVFVSRLLWWSPLYSFSQANHSSLPWYKIFVCQWYDTPWFLWFDTWKFSLPVISLYPLCAWTRLSSASRASLSSVGSGAANTSITLTSKKTINRCLCSFKNQFVLVQRLFLTAQRSSPQVQNSSGPAGTPLLGQAWKAFLEATSLKL